VVGVDVGPAVGAFVGELHGFVIGNEEDYRRCSRPWRHCRPMDEVADGDADGAVVGTGSELP
jgi:hypothetical protein